jgi:catechol 2,3-dioxygenase-like lactoylglutathione lyase family enzyme
MNIIKRMDHFTIVTKKLEETLEFYEALGLKSGVRPDFGVPGFWFYVNDHPVLHVIGVEQMPSPVRGGLDHMAFWGEDLGATWNWLKERGIACKLIKIPRPWRTWQIFFDDPNGVEVEIDFHESEPEPEGWRKPSQAKVAAE